MKSDPNQVNRKILERGWREAGAKKGLWTRKQNALLKNAFHADSFLKAVKNYSREQGRRTEGVDSLTFLFTFQSG